MAVYSSQRGGTTCLILQVTERFEVYDMVTINLRDEKIVNGEIVFIEKDKVHITGPYLPIEIIPFEKISHINPWTPPEEWK